MHMCKLYLRAILSRSRTKDEFVSIGLLIANKKDPPKRVFQEGKVSLLGLSGEVAGNGRIDRDAEGPMVEATVMDLR